MGNSLVFLVCIPTFTVNSFGRPCSSFLTQFWGLDVERMILLCREIKMINLVANNDDLATHRQHIYQQHFLGFCLKPPPHPPRKYLCINRCFLETKPVIFYWS